MNSLALVLAVVGQDPVSPSSASANLTLELFLLVQVVIPSAWGFVIPFLTELVTKAHAPAGVRTFLTGLLSALGGVVSTVTLTGLDGASWLDYFAAIVAAWLVAGRVYVANLADPVARATPDLGIGPKTTVQ